MKKIVTIILLVIALSGIGKAQTVGNICFSGDKDSRDQILQNVLFNYLKTQNYREYTAWYLSTFYTDSIFKNSTDIAYNVTRNGGFKILDKLRENEFNAEDFFNEKPCLINSLSFSSFKYKNIETIIEDKLTGITVQPVRYTIDKTNINTDFITKERKRVEEWMDNIAFSIVTDINANDIIIPDESIKKSKVNPDTIKNYFVKALQPDELTKIKQIFTNKNLKLSAGSLTNPGDVFYLMPASDNAQHKNAFLSKTDYSFLIKISNLRLDYLPDGNSNPKWQITSVTINIELSNLFSDKAGSMANYSISFNNIRSTVTGPDSYRELTDILSDYIFAAINTEFLEIGKISNDNNFFTQLYTQLNDVFHPTGGNGFEYAILIQQKDIQNIDENTITKLINNMNVPYTFTTTPARQMENNNIKYIKVNLRDCYFPISEFEDKFKIKLEDKTNTSFINWGNSPHQMLVLIPKVGDDSPCWFFNNEKTVEFNLKNCKCTNITTDSITVTCEDENWNTYTTRTQVIDENTIRVAILDKNGQVIPYKEDIEYIFKFTQNNNKFTVPNVRR